MDTTILTSSDFQAFLFGFRSEQGRRMASLLRATGLRSFEGCALRVRDVGDGQVFVRRGKGGRSRSTAVLPGDRVWLRELVEGRLGEEVVVGGRPSPSSVRRQFRAASKWSGVECHPHLLRHGYAVELARHPGLTLVHVQRCLGHARATTTDVYLRKVGCDVVVDEVVEVLS